MNSSGSVIKLLTWIKILDYYFYRIERDLGETISNIEILPSLFFNDSNSVLLLSFLFISLPLSKF